VPAIEAMASAVTTQRTMSVYAVRANQRLVERRLSFAVNWAPELRAKQT
jgi:hypothetical protein